MCYIDKGTEKAQTRTQTQDFRAGGWPQAGLGSLEEPWGSPARPQCCVQMHELLALPGPASCGLDDAIPFLLLVLGLRSVARPLFGVDQGRGVCLRGYEGLRNHVCSDRA